MSEEKNVAALRALITKAKEDQALDPSEIHSLKQSILIDRKVSPAEASLLFELAEQAKDWEDTDAFEECFVQALTSYLLNTTEDPGHLDIESWIWLQDRIAADHQYSRLEQALLKNLVLEAQSLPPNFHEWLSNLEVHLRDFDGDLDALEYKSRTSFFTELKSLLKRFTH
ncbi:MAG: hypothetical protein H6858_07440 [Rhodospirillales bacterium]|nr:hypothetical protein [Alphaproteobacteria bacterium]MCB1840488.1 hypothetical protein [Alphaproteobacteria bacterium]MCB9977414.1 hypothetical protein [Rhodospirillales bacterium]